MRSGADSAVPVGPATSPRCRREHCKQRRWAQPLADRPNLARAGSVPRTIRDDFTFSSSGRPAVQLNRWSLELHACFPDPSGSHGRHRRRCRCTDGVIDVQPAERHAPMPGLSDSLAAVEHAGGGSVVRREGHRAEVELAIWLDLRPDSQVPTKRSSPSNRRERRLRRRRRRLVRCDCSWQFLL